ncbi:Eukaryotic translation initiation factor 2 subunit beta [Morus notabilis]|uniref:Eukaryotic translation initiation factor 2 subunit beta n=1 Tax=Morus notabilis TaxID=981085 RepID=W9QYM9_9ROSA|nr:Eukaryotic translation initiation factor 2 subunit beta [Morus notabilis]
MADENEVKEEVAEIAPFDPTKKKKKKKVIIQDPADESVESLAEKTENLSVSEGIESSFSGLKKKKKKPVESSILTDEGADAGEELEDRVGDDEEGEGIDLQPRYPWEGSDRDYEYEELLGRVFNILRENNPELAGDRRRTVMRPPQVLREGTKKTVFVNFMDLCKSMHRQPDHVMTFLLAELGTNGSLDGQQRLVVKGRFAPKNFEGILRRYINEYVICLGCKSPDTILSKENRLFFLRCEKVISCLTFPICFQTTHKTDLGFSDNINIFLRYVKAWRSEVAVNFLSSYQIVVVPPTFQRSGTPFFAVPVDQLPRLKLVLLLVLVVGTPELDPSHSLSLSEALSVF